MSYNHGLGQEEGLRVRFEEQTLPHLDVLHRVALHLAPNDHEAERLVRDLFVRTYRQWSQTGVDELSRAWLVRAMVNRFYDNHLSVEHA